MHYPINLSSRLEQQLRDQLKLKEHDKILAITAFGDTFVQCIKAGKSEDPNDDRSKGLNAEQVQHLLYSFTDGTLSDVTDLINEHGLPPVSLDLGDEWYQLSAQAMLHADGLRLADDECFGFELPVFEGGDYGPQNIAVVKIADYQSALLPKLERIN